MVYGWDLQSSVSATFPAFFFASCRVATNHPCPDWICVYVVYSVYKCYCSLNITYRTSSEMRLRGSGGYRLYIGWRSETSWCHLSQTSILYSIKSAMENKHWLGLRNLRVLVFDIIWHMIWACRSPTMIQGCCGNTAFGLMRLSGHELIPTWHLRNAAIATPLYYRMVPPNYKLVYEPHEL
jgi:hypothetical protein